MAQIAFNVIFTKNFIKKNLSARRGHWKWRNDVTYYISSTFTVTVKEYRHRTNAIYILYKLTYYSDANYFYRKILLTL